MTASLWLRNLIACGVQAGFLIAAGAVLARVLRINTPRVALAYWRIVLLACMVLPFVQPVRTPPAATLSAGVATALPVSSGVPARPQDLKSEPWRPSMPGAVATLVILGIGARAVWLMVGVWMLGRIRREALALDPLPQPFRQAEERVGVRAAVLLSNRIAGPITFGVRRPVIVLPPSFAAMNEPIQHAIACHELLHVRRRDWIFEVAEECLRTVLWFHPALWWLINRVQLTREQVVDEAAVQIIQSRSGYVEALLAVALAKSPSVLAPASAFLRRRVLKKRVALILQESRMTTRRMILSLTASAAVLALSAIMATRSFPLQAQEPPVVSGNGPVQIVKGGEHLLHGGVPEYPHRAIEGGVEGDVVLDIAVDDRGEVSDARVLSGPDELRKAALEAVLGWHYSAAAVRSMSTQATLRFHVPPPETALTRAEFRGDVWYAAKSDKVEIELGAPTDKQQVEHVMRELDHVINDRQASSSEREEAKARLEIAKAKLDRLNDERLRRVRTDGSEAPVRAEGAAGTVRLAHVTGVRVSEEAIAVVMARAGLKIGAPFGEDTLYRLRAAATNVDDHLRVEMGDTEGGNATVFIISR